ncbi:bifunctional [glutamate--ammonia ligase]-adenylyl-L-tyrosine phosphorylase/[glutamate--ammonia-ligase] adenylyltransferase [Reinekea blandensis]|uniref:Bifunctional glutamine synthetase adenylyltransferase/adenylyl-removing enzyme n=1 Tax=Reinekea blandensis MED297 TaxID=314283 RepID=A4BAL4_9GAMM|nr:bifunctional [glutamate--ammonia ligase]-adenylyl-L-tyrosine phosphorylase/[glutamate--ammonia-ligase] adenylyltransferase [Reinekea blandensis]EAR10970.1 glutamate-ammonia-ligase adenylyltransferase [Reinekea sp. MED297] [Reinekea blandensis MED297]
MTLSKVLKKEQSRYLAETGWASLDDAQIDALMRVALASPWFAGWLKHQSDYAELMAFCHADDVTFEDLDALAEHWSVDEQDQVMADLRHWRNRHMARLIARDVWGMSTVRDTARAVSDMADRALTHALAWSTAFWRAKEGVAAVCPHSGEPQQLIVIAMGKHGASELNLSSDIDLIFAYPAQGQTSEGRDHESYFTRIGRKLIQLLDTRTADGFVFRVDMRLRPWGQSGALVSGFKALENYYLQQGRFWERYALVKARPVTGHPAAQEALMAILHPFVYRRYVDFQAVGALRDLKSKIQKEVRRQNLDRNVKLGAGGIREVEFIAQVFQLVRGGQDEILQQRGTWPVLSVLKSMGLMPAEAVDELVAAYDFLRDLEHRIQAIRDEQTQNLPVDETDLERLALSLNFKDASELLDRLAEHRARVQTHFSQLISDQDNEHDTAKQEALQEAWQAEKWAGAGENALTDAMQVFHELPGVKRLSGMARDNLDAFMPLLWAELRRHSDAVERFDAIRPILEAVLRRSSYFSLLRENPQAIRELVKLVPASPWIGRLLEEKPFLLDELTDVDQLYRLPNRSELMDDLHQQLLRVPEEDLERQMELLRHFRHGRALRAAACEVAAHLPLMKISDYLAWVAEVVVEQALSLVWRAQVARHGRPSKADGDWCDPDFGVIAYGKMGGLELSYESDLDLVFLHNADPQGMTEGPKSVENVVFMTRLGQKLIHLLSAVTPSGMLYEVDTRLRPSGNSGLLVSSLGSFMKYQQEQAWVWEHQALVRARFIAGDVRIREAFDGYRRQLICQSRDPHTLAADVVAMRQKMLDHLSSAATGESAEVFHVKQDPGGIVDLEFLVQYLLLSHAHDHPDVAKWSDNIRSIEELARAGVLTDTEQQQWLEAYLVLRQQIHHAVLAGDSKKVPLEDMSEELVQVRERIQSAWASRLLSQLPTAEST